MSSLEPSVESVVLRTAVPMDFESICALNGVQVQHTSPMDAARLDELNALSCYHKVISVEGIVSAFLLAILSGAPYQNENFGWFSQRYPRFIYIDRVVVSSASMGLGFGSRLYKDLFRHARSKAIPLIACEYNIIPANEPSRLFHDTLGFKEQGTQWVANGSKRVSLQVAALSDE
jgi:predicted GNAT superfamily acetyltransferase